MRSGTVRSLGVAAISVIAVAVAGCSGGGSSSPSGASGSDTLRVAWTTTPTQLDPNVFTGLNWVMTSDAYMATLLEYDTSKGGDKIIGVKDLKLSLAESYEANAAGTEYTFKLRKGVKSQYGNELKADDVIYSFQRMLSTPTSLQAGVLLPTANVNKEKPWEKVDDYTLKYRLNKPSAVSLSILAYPILGILDSTEVKKHATTDDPWAAKWLKDHTAGFGPYQLKSFNPGQEVRLEQNPNYFDTKPYFKEIVLKAVPEGSSRAQLLMSGDVDMISEPPIDQLKKIDASSRAKVSKQPDSNRHNLSVNMADPALGKPEVRHAISHAINRDAIVSSIYQGYAKPAYTPMSSVLFDNQPELGKYDPELAKQELAAAGYPNGLDIELSFSTERPGPYAENLGRLIQADLAKVGVKASLKAVPSVADFEGAVSAKKLQSYLYTERPSQPDIGFALYLYLFKGSSLNKSGYSNPELDRLTQQALGLAPGAERDAVVGQALKVVAEGEPIISLVEVPDLAGVAKDLKGFVALPTGGAMFQELSRG
ncbi:ABC transporter substrate-binding protein [Dactylosporangium sucinum]|uniref:ABC transporter substrate-binding protein n=2 Tax=Dactylosporangium sucinum TaxID=1424081 RepID=A0A917WZV5_9ACTN|nr:ABC transporter substrate-binding protein [Dactylosporangium sucinum]